MSLLARFKEFIDQERLFTTNDRLLLAVSGGIDSAVLCELCYQGGYDFVIAHCNFQLREAESARDEQFVRELGKKYGKEVLVKQFDTAAYAAGHKVSIQVAARELRYTWFGEVVGSQESGVRSQESGVRSRESGVGSWESGAGNEELPASKRQLAAIVTAHHLDDNIETVLLKFFKGTGIAGMRGILPKQGKLVRPLLWARKEELVQFARDHALSWVEDSSNAQDKYARNYLRNQVVPLLQKIYPDVVNNLADNIARFREVEVLYHQSLDAHKKKLLEYKGGEVHIPVLKLKKTAPLHTLVYEVARPYGFSAAQTAEIIQLLDSASGRYVASATHRIIRNRQWLIIAPLATEAAHHILIEEHDQVVPFAAGSLQLEQEQRASDGGPGATGDALPVSGNHIAYIDSRHLHYPLLLRPWKAGDYFYPLGMPKKKKLARFFIDQKLSRTDKEKVWVLESNKRIVWVVGLRIDDRFKITDITRTVLKIAFTPGAGTLSPAR